MTSEGLGEMFKVDPADMCGCLKKPHDISNPASECKFIYNHILNYKMKIFLSIIFENQSFVYWNLEFRIVNHLGKL
jgi:hypothetical protein